MSENVDLEDFDVPGARLKQLCVLVAQPSQRSDQVGDELRHVVRTQVLGTSADAPGG